MKKTPEFKKCIGHYLK